MAEAGGCEGKAMRAHAEIPIRTKSSLNQREHWAAKARRVKAEREATYAMLMGQLRVLQAGEGATVTLTRVAPRLLDDDNLRGALKAVRDAIAFLLGRDDKPGSGIEWRYAQKQGKPREYAVVAEVVMEVTQISTETVS